MTSSATIANTDYFISDDSKTFPMYTEKNLPYSVTLNHTNACTVMRKFKRRIYEFLHCSLLTHNPLNNLSKLLHIS